MTRPEDTTTPLGQRLRERTQALAPDDASYGYAHAYLSDALVRGLEQVAQIIDPPDPWPPWAPLFDIDGCPDFALAWLGQAVGVTIKPGTDPDLARELIRGMLGTRRGSVAAIEAAIRAVLGNPDATVYFRERDPSGADPPYTLEVVTLVSETPNPALVQRAILSQKPGGIVLTSRTVVGWDYQAMTAEGGKYSALPAKFATYAKLSYNERTP